MNIDINPGHTTTVTLHPSAPLTKGPNWNLLSGSTTPNVAADGLSADFRNDDPNGGQTIVAVSAVDANNQVTGFLLGVNVVAVPTPPTPADLNPSA